MKKRILSLFLALAMVATAAVVPGTSAEAAYVKNDGLINLEKMGSFMKITSSDRTGYWEPNIGLEVGDVLSYEEPSAAKSGEFQVKGENNRFAPANTSNIHVVWVKREVKATSNEEWEVAGEGLTYTIEKEDIGSQFAVIAYTDLSDGNTTAASGASMTGTLSYADDEWTVENIIGAFNPVVSQSAVGASYGLTITVGGNTVVKAAISNVSSPVNKGKAKKEHFSVASAKVGSTEFATIGNNLYIKANAYKGNPADVKITFNVENEATSDVLKGKDKAYGGASDPLFWIGAGVGQDGKIVATTSTDNVAAADLTMDNAEPGKTFNTVSKSGLNAGDAYRLYVGRNTAANVEGKYFTVSDQAIKTDYILSVIATGPSAVLYMGEMKEGEEVKGGTTISGDAQSLRYIEAAISGLDGTRRVTLPEAGTLRKTDDKGKVVAYLQGWSTYSNTGALIRDTEYIKLATDKVYYAVWGEKEPELVHHGVPVYRVYNTANGEHLYTADINEYKSLIAQGWNDEGIKIYGLNQQPDNQTGAFAVRRMYNPNSGEHIYVQDASNEMNTLARLGWTIEANIYVSPAVGDPVYRLWNGQAGVGCHLWTMDTNEVNVLRTQYGWQYEGTPFNSEIQ